MIKRNLLVPTVACLQEKELRNDGRDERSNKQGNDDTIAIQGVTIVGPIARASAVKHKAGIQFFKTICAQNEIT